MNKNKITLLATSIFFYLLIGSCFASLYVKPAKLGILRVQIYSFAPAVVEREFEVGNTYDFPINIHLEATGNLSTAMKLSETDFSLQPNETKTIEYSLTIKDSGIYMGGVAIRTEASEKRPSIVYQADLAVIANKSSMAPEVYGIIIALIVLVVVAVFIRYRLTGKKVRRK